MTEAYFQKLKSAVLSRKRVKLTSLATINFSIFRRINPCLVVLNFGSLHQNLQKIYLPQGAKQFQKNIFFHKRAEIFEKYMIFKKILAMSRGKYVFSNLMSLTLLRLHCIYGKDNACSGDPLHAKALKRPPCPMYVAGQGCTKREIAAAKSYRRRNS